MLDKRLIAFFLVLGATILATYYLPEVAKTGFYILLLIAYFRSKNEAMWLTLFLVISDGFWGYFNNYEVVLSVIPGLPPIEIGHFYVALSVIKAHRVKERQPLFFDTYIKVIVVYILFLVAQGYLLGLSPELNVQFRMVKFIFPLLMFYSIPRLFQKEEDYRECFYYFFPLAFFALFAQIFTITTGMTPSQFLGVHKDFWFTVDVHHGKTYRGFYSTRMVMLSFFGALFYLANKAKTFNPNYLFAVVAADFMSAFLSATRGWLLGLSFALICFTLFIAKVSARRVLSVVLTLIILIGGLLSIPVIGTQFTNAFKRMTTLEALAGGDLTAGHTLERLDKRSPRVMNKWSETPLTGWGFSDTFFKYADFHVGNQTILLHSGILGAILMGMFFVYYHFTLYHQSSLLPRGHPLKGALLVFVVFFPGWFMIHSSSGQSFSYYQDPGGGIHLGLYFCFGAVVYRHTLKRKKSNTHAPPPEATVEERTVH